MNIVNNYRLSASARPIFVGVSGSELSDAEIKLFHQYPPAGFILFKRNITSKTQLLALTTSLKQLFPKVWVPILIDQEGGRVARLKPPVATKLYPPAADFAALYQTDPKAAKVALSQNIASIAQELKNFHIDSACGPVSDLLFPDTNQVIGDRAYGADPQQVIELAEVAIQTMQTNKLLAFLKHIPGHGRAKIDSHLQLPVVKTALSELQQTDFRVFKELSTKFEHLIQQGLLWGMTAHITFTALDNQPVTISKTCIDYIRHDIGFKGILLSDDLNMGALHSKAAQEYLSSKAAIHKNKFLDSLQLVAAQSLNAGCDYLLHCSGDLEEMQLLLPAITNNI